MPRDLDEVFRIATRSGMRLHLTDYHLATARLALRNGDRTQAREHFEKAEALVQETATTAAIPTSRNSARNSQRRPHNPIRPRHM